MTRSPTLDDVAHVAGVSRATASIVLNGSKGNIGVSDETSARVRAVAKKLGYAPNRAAVALAKRRSNAVAIVVSSLNNDPDATYANAVVQRLHKEGIDALLLVTKLEEALQDILHSSVDGVLILSQDDRRLEQHASLVERVNQESPCVVVGAPSPLDVSSVFPDREGGVFSAANHLLELGHRSIGFVFVAEPDHPAIVERLEGLSRALKERGIAVPRDLIFSLKNWAEVERFGEREIWSLRERPSALIMEDDWLALQIMKGVYRSGREVPRDLSIVGFGDLDVAAVSFVPLTTVRCPYSEIAKSAVDLLAAQIDAHRSGTARPPKHVRVPMSLDVRDSTTPDLIG